MARPTAAQALDALRGLKGYSGVTGGMLGISLDFEPTVLITAKSVDKLGIDIRSFREPLSRAVREVMVPSIRQNFEVGGRPPWDPLASSTLRVRKRMNRPTGSILIDTGTLMRAATQLNIWKIGRNTAVVTGLPSRAWYGAIHQAGSTGRSATRGGGGGITYRGRPIGRGRDGEIPARPFIVIQDQDQKKIQQVFLKWLEERIERHWSRRGRF